MTSYVQCNLRIVVWNQRGLFPWFDIFKGHIEPMTGRPMSKQFVPTQDLFKQTLDKNTADMMSFVNLHIALASDEVLRNEFQVLRRMFGSHELRRMSNMVTAVENIHVTMLGSLHDPSTTPLEYAMINELAEMRLHKLGYNASENANSIEVQNYCFEEDEKHLRWLMDAYSRIEEGDASLFEPSDRLYAMPEMSTMDYINQIARTQMNMVSRGMGFEMAA